MPTIKIEFETDNVAFEDNLKGEIKRVLKQAVTAILAHKGKIWEESSDLLFDTNGNSVGVVEVKK